MTITLTILSLFLLCCIHTKGAYSIKIDLKERYQISEGSAGRKLFSLPLTIDVGLLGITMDATVASKFDSYKEACALYRLHYEDNKLELKLQKEADYEIKSQRLCNADITIKIDCHILIPELHIPMHILDCHTTFMKEVTLEITDEV